MIVKYQESETVLLLTTYYCTEYVLTTILAGRLWSAKCHRHSGCFPNGQNVIGRNREGTSRGRGRGAVPILGLGAKIPPPFPPEGADFFFLLILEYSELSGRPTTGCGGGDADICRLKGEGGPQIGISVLYPVGAGAGAALCQPSGQTVSYFYAVSVRVPDQYAE